MHIYIEKLNILESGKELISSIFHENFIFL